jgi:hypothetical protein
MSFVKVHEVQMREIISTGRDIGTRFPSAKTNPTNCLAVKPVRRQTGCEEFPCLGVGNDVLRRAC